MLTAIDIINACTPIDEQSFKRFCQMMLVADLLYHFDDDPRDQIKIKTGEPTFTEDESAALLDYMYDVYNVISDPIQVALDVIEENN